MASDAHAHARCPGCGVDLPAQSTPTHPYIGASPSCWALYGQVLAREYGDPRLMRVHRLTVDAYAAQHPGVPGRRTTQSVWVHLAGLHLCLVRGASPDFARRVMAELTTGSDGFVWLPPPEERGAITVREVAGAETAAHGGVVRRWAEAVWAAWSAHHAAVADLAERAAGRL